MRKLLLQLFILALSGNLSAQSTSFSSRQYVFGTMVGKTDTLVGYFWFDREVDYRGEKFFYKETPETESSRKLWVKNYEFFDSEDVHLENFLGSFGGAHGKVPILLPRIVDGEMELFSHKFPSSFGQGEQFFVKFNGEKILLKRSSFKKQMRIILKDDPVLLGKVERDEVKYDDLPAIVITFNKRTLRNPPAEQEAPKSNDR